MVTPGGPGRCNTRVVRRIIFSLLALLPAIVTAGPYPYSYDTVKVADGIYAFIEPRGRAVVSSNTLLIVGEDAAALIDTGHHPPLARKIVAEIRALTAKPLRYIVNTHWHNDHVA